MREFHEPVREWEAFYLLIATAGATLARLMFVSTTISERVTNQYRPPILRAHSDPALLAFVLCLVMGALMLRPSLIRPWFGALQLAAGLLALLYLSRVLPQLIRSGQIRGWDASD